MKFFKVVFFFCCVFVITDAVAQSSAELKRRREKLTNELEQLNREYLETSRNKKTTLKQLNILKVQINLREEKIKNVNSEIRLLDNQISENSNTVRTLQGQLDQLKKEYAAMVLFAYHNQSAYNKLMFIFAAKDFNQAYKRLKYLQQFGTYRERQAESIQGTQKDLNIKITELDRTKKEKSNLLQTQEKEKETLGKERNNQAAVVASLSKQQGALKKQQRAVQQQMARINNQIAAAIRREIEEARRKEEARIRAAQEAEARAAAAKAKSENREAPVVAKPKAVTRTTSEYLNATPEAAKLSNDFLGNRGRLPWPVANGNVTQGFGPYIREGIKNYNNGVEIRTSAGAPVRAVFDGEVTTVSNVTGTFLVLIKHGEYFTAYNNLRSVSVREGQKVSTKQTIGTVGIDPLSGDAVIQFFLNKGRTVVNPESWLAPN